VVQVEHVLAGRVLSDDRVVDVRRALRLAGGAGGVVHDGVVLGVRRHRLEFVRLAAYRFVPENDPVAGLGLLATGHENDVLEVRKLAPYLLDTRPQLRRRNEHLGTAIRESVLYRFRAEGGEERADDRAQLQRAEGGEVALRDALEGHEDAVALLDAEAA